MTAAIHAFAEALHPARALATALRLSCHEIALRRFPDGESLVRVAPMAEPGTAYLYRSLDRPNDKLVEILLAAAALRENGARAVVLIAPYLGYMRQDKAFHPGEAVSAGVVGSLLAQDLDGVITLDPHLHRITDFSEAIPGIDATALTAAPVLTGAIDTAGKPFLVGPDSESRQWVDAIAAPLGLPVLIGEKQRHGDRDISLVIDGIEAVKGRRAILVDDVISSGTTLREAARLLHGAGAAGVEALATHCLADGPALTALAQAGIDSVRATDSVESPVGTIAIAPVLAAYLRDRLR